MEYGQVLTDLMTKLDLHNLDILGVVLPCALAFLGGYLVYIFCMIILFKEHTSCYPYWMHTFYFACDFMGGIFWIKLATMTGNFWAFYAFGICMFIWVILEIICMYFSAKWERQEVFGSFFKGEVTMGKAAGTYIVQILMWMFVIANFIHMLGGFADAAFFKLYFWTNLMVPLGPCWFWHRRGVKTGRVGSGLALNIMILVTIIITWTPAGIGMWCSISDYFWSPTFIIAGIGTMLIAIWNVVYQFRLPKKPEVIPGKKPLP
ncbi:MAG: hypothetical protein E7567_07580 [Ruminococcaceae bacterium]|nr:hypothetical protein [Oscillospiraceae bacterium]